MAYQFSNEIVAKMKVTDDSDNDITLNGINGQETDANVIMGGINTLFDIVGWGTQNAIRIVNQDVQETE